MVEVTMPMLGLTMEEGTVAEWLKQEGEAVQKDEPLLTVEMDKGTVEVPSPASGVLQRIVVPVGTTVPVKALIAEVAAPGAPAQSTPASAAQPPRPATPVAAGGPGDLPPRPAVAASGASQPAPPDVAVAPAPAGGPGDLPPRPAVAPAGEPRQHAAPTASRPGERLFASPRARLRARALGLDLRAIQGTGPRGRIVEADVLGARVLATPLARRLAQEHGVPIDQLQGSGPGGRITQEDVLRAATPATTAPLSRLRRLTAERMAASAQATARVTLHLEADFSELRRFRAQLQPEFARLGVPKLNWDALLAKAAALALVEHPALALQWADGQALRRASDGIGIGVAVALEPEGLVVPVLRNADSRALRELAGELLALADKARANRLSPAEMQGGAFSITNLGAYRVDGFTPIINPPETAILGVGRIADKAVVIDGRVEPRTMCTLSLSFDHRVVDGAPAAAFLARLAELLERPYTLLGI